MARPHAPQVSTESLLVHAYGAEAMACHEALAHAVTQGPTLYDQAALLYTVTLTLRCQLPRQHTTRARSQPWPSPPQHAVSQEQSQKTNGVPP